MQIDAAADISATPLGVEAAAVAAEADGFDGFGVPETSHDVFTSLALAARATSGITVQSAIAVAFARNPMSVAMLANDIQLISGGRFQLGLGSQVGPHIERRFSMPWSHPAARMEEFVGAIRAVWSSWATGAKLRFRGTFYQHTLMTDFFNPGRVFNVPSSGSGLKKERYALLILLQVQLRSAHVIPLHVEAEEPARMARSKVLVPRHIAPAQHLVYPTRSDSCGRGLSQPVRPRCTAWVLVAKHA